MGVLVLNSATWSKYAPCLRIRLWRSPVLSLTIMLFLFILTDITADFSSIHHSWRVLACSIRTSTCLKKFTRTKANRLKNRPKAGLGASDRSRICGLVWVCCEKLDYPTSSETSPVVWWRPDLPRRVRGPTHLRSQQGRRWLMTLPWINHREGTANTHIRNRS